MLNALAWIGGFFAPVPFLLLLHKMGASDTSATAGVALLLGSGVLMFVTWNWKNKPDHNGWLGMRLYGWIYLVMSAVILGNQIKSDIFN